MTYRMTPKPLGTPMDLHFFGGIPHDVYLKQPVKSNSNTQTLEWHCETPETFTNAKPAELPIEVLEARRHIKKRKRS